ncbi:MAG: 16S rRNA (guanine(527)-N(7))-methyltransferase RsmG [Anaerolineales bacterium]|nr:16S rRNA (guanine(527)-N(7))-methyltransferase RsmG [Anaerolineales bacterium]
MARSVKDLIGISLSSGQLNSLLQFEAELLDWNTRFNLTAIQEPEKIRSKHFLDSLTCLTVIKEKPIERLIDIGTGAGFPGIPLKIACPQLHVTLVESVGKKANFCRHIVKSLGLDGVEVVQERAETLGQMPHYREKFDWVVARAVAALPILVEYLLPLARIGGSAIAMKGESGPAEAHAADRATHLLGGRLRRLTPIILPGVVDERYLVVIDKVAATPLRYPRRVGIPAKKPI